MRRGVDFYTIAIQRWSWLPFMKRYRVVYHDVEHSARASRAGLVLKDFSSLSIPGLDRKKLRVYPDYNTYLQHNPPREQLPPAQ